jgi:tRNA threonylcarbamoyl adenosine modification protein YeaZ/ribosomal-protein-alanine acetyltransferase
MRLLALDTAMAACSAAVLDDRHELPLAKAYVPMLRGHAEAIAPLVRAVMERADTAFSELDRIVMTRGPGTFTGVRIGLAMARGLGLALSIPVVGLDTLRAIAANEPAGDAALLVASEARHGEIYAALFAASGVTLSPPAAIAVAAGAALLPGGPALVLGSAAEAVIAASGRGDVMRSRAGDLPDAANFGRLGFACPPPSAPPAPLYLRVPEAKPQLRPLAATLHTANAALLAALHAECFEAPWSAEEFASLLAMPGAFASAAMADGEPVGFLLTRSTAGEAEIVTLGTRPSARRRGIARSLLGHELRRLARSGVGALFIEVAVSNAAARSLYAACGFREAGLRRGYYHGRNGGREDGLVMRREIAR